MKMTYKETMLTSRQRSWCYVDDDDNDNDNESNVQNIIAVTIPASSATQALLIPHIKFIRAKCLRKLNIIKILSHPKTGCNRKIRLPFHQSLIRSVLEFGSPIYGLASPSQLVILDTFQN